jgi:hypothetical protein
MYYVQNMQKYEKKKCFYVIDVKPNRGYTENRLIWI